MTVPQWIKDLGKVIVAALMLVAAFALGRKNSPKSSNSTLTQDAESELKEKKHEILLDKAEASIDRLNQNRPLSPVVDNSDLTELVRKHNEGSA